MRYRAAAIQFDPVLGELEENLTRLLGLIEEAAAEGAKLIVAPEMATSGYCFRDREEIAPYVEPIPGPTTERLLQIARETASVIVCGLPELEERTGLYYNSAVAVGPGGLLGTYRKVHHFACDAKWSVEGNLGFPVWDTSVGRMGIEICMDAVYPESARLLALAGAQVICFPTNWVGSGGCPSQRWISQAFENGVYLIAADRSGTERGVEFQGGSCIVDPDGCVLSSAALGDAVVYADIDLPEGEERPFDTRREEDKLRDRRPMHYHEMLQNTYGWSATYFQTLYGHPGLPAPRESMVTALQFAPVQDAPSENCENVRRMLGAEPADLAVLPERALTGVGSIPRACGENGLHHIEQLLRLAGQTDTFLVTSVVEEMDGRLYNAAVLVDGDGVRCVQRKHHLSQEDRAWASPGTEPFTTVDTPAGRIGLLVGYDALFWESFRVLAVLGADLVCVPAALRRPRLRTIGEGCDWLYWRTKAWESHVALAIANYPGPEFAGSSTLTMPAVREQDHREAIAGEVGDACLSLQFDTGSTYVREKRGLNWRRLHAYYPLVAHRGS